MLMRSAVEAQFLHKFALRLRASLARPPLSEEVPLSIIIMLGRQCFKPAIELL